MATDVVQIGGVPIKAYDFGDYFALATMYPAYSGGAQGELISGTAALAGPDVACKLAVLVADGNNAGTVYVGMNGTSVTTPDGTADTTTGVPLPPAGTLGPLPIANLSQLGHAASADSQRLFYITLT